MIYINVMRVISRLGDTGVNIYVHHREGPVPQRFWTGTESPGSSIAALDRIEVPREEGHGNISAFLDAVLDDEDYARTLVERALDDLSKAIEVGTPNPVARTFREGRRAVHMVFSVSWGLEDLASKVRVFRETSAKLRRWLSQHDARIMGEIGLRPTGTG